MTDPNKQAAEDRAKREAEQRNAQNRGQGVQSQSQGAEQQDEGNGDEEVRDEGAFPGQNPAQPVILPSDPQGDLDLQGYVEGRLPEQEEEEEPAAG